MRREIRETPCPHDPRRQPSATSLRELPDHPHERESVEIRIAVEYWSEVRVETELKKRRF
jgi:hypothetical protein